MSIADNIKDSDCLDIEELCSEVGVGVQRMRQILAKAKKSGKVQWVVKKNGQKFLYTPQFVEQLMAFINKGGAGKPRGKTAKSFSTAQLVVQVPVFDTEVANLLKRKFKTENDMSKFLQDRLEETVRPALTAIQKLKERHAKELQAAMFADES